MILKSSRKLILWSTMMKVFVCCLFVNCCLQLKHWNKIHLILLLLTPLHETIIWQTKLFMDGQKYTKLLQLLQCDFSRCQNHMMTKFASMDRNIYGLRGWVAVQIPQLTAISETC